MPTVDASLLKMPTRARAQMAPPIGFMPNVSDFFCGKIGFPLGQHDRAVIVFGSGRFESDKKWQAFTVMFLWVSQNISVISGHPAIF
jgi:hypothetical protein